MTPIFRLGVLDLEQFLHGPRVTLDKQSSLVAFTSITEPRKDSLIKYAKTIGTEVIEINEKTFNGVSKEFTWFAQLLYGQQLALELSKRLGTNPDTVRSDQSTYKEARKSPNVVITKVGIDTAFIALPT